jgi:hypothetical protein
LILVNGRFQRLLVASDMRERDQVDEDEEEERGRGTRKRNEEEERGRGTRKRNEEAANTGRQTTTTTALRLWMSLLQRRDGI